jgi:RNA polymerase sigma-32 factor
MVTTLAAKYRHYGLPLCELVAEGNSGLVRALEKFDPSRGVRYATYAAYWVRASMLGYVLRSRSIVCAKGGVMRSRLFFKFRRERARLSATLGEGEAMQRALAERLGVSLARVRCMAAQVDTQDVSLDATPPDSSTRWADQLSSSSDPESQLLAARFEGGVTAAVALALRALDARERYIVESRLMAESESALSLAQIGRRLGISGERARQLELVAIRKLRGALSASNDPVVAEWVLSVA